MIEFIDLQKRHDSLDVLRSSQFGSLRSKVLRPDYPDAQFIVIGQILSLS